MRRAITTAGACLVALAQPYGVLGQDATAPAATAPQQQATAQEKTFTQQDLDELLAPIALYPDALLAQVLMASTYPLEIVEAARWQKANPTLKDKALEDALEKQTWDPSVKSLTAVPQVLTMMNEKLDWTQKLGDAFLAQQEDVMKTVQALRKKAEAAGNLKSTEQMTVKKETERQRPGHQDRAAQARGGLRADATTRRRSTARGGTRRIRRPTTTTRRATPTARVSPSPPAWSWAPRSGATATGAATTSTSTSTSTTTSTRPTSRTATWNHNAEHRKGVAYRDSGPAQKYNRGGERAGDAVARAVPRPRRAGPLGDAAHGPQPAAGGRSFRGRAQQRRSGDRAGGGSGGGDQRSADGGGADRRRQSRRRRLGQRDAAQRRHGGRLLGRRRRRRVDACRQAPRRSEPWRWWRRPWRRRTSLARRPDPSRRPT